ncbi:MAG: hypothetical protein AAFX86_13625 [Pseudomonadota bacterium]
MIRLAQFAIGASLFLGGTAKAMHHLGTTDPMAAYWCRPSALTAPDTTFWLFEPHCWGCGLALLGALLMAHGVWKTLASRVTSAPKRPARLRTL